MLEEKIYKDYVEALKSKNRDKTDFLSLVRAELKNQAIDLKKNKLEDSEVLPVLKKQQKRLQDAKEAIASSERKDLLQSIENELALLAEYLPQPLSDEELSKIIEEVITEAQASSMKDMGRVMKEVIEKAGARADSKKISEIVKAKLSSA